MPTPDSYLKQVLLELARIDDRRTTWKVRLQHPDESVACYPELCRFPNKWVMLLPYDVLQHIQELRVTRTWMGRHGFKGTQAQLDRAYNLVDVVAAEHRTGSQLVRGGSEFAFTLGDLPEKDDLAFFVYNPADASLAPVGLYAVDAGFGEILFCFPQEVYQAVYNAWTPECGSHS